MKKTPLVILLLCVLLAACAPSQSSVQDVIATVKASWTATPSNTPPPADTSTTVQTPTAIYRKELETVLQQYGFTRAPELDSKCNVECSSWVYGDQTAGSTYLIAIALDNGIGLVLPLDGGGNIDSAMGALVLKIIQNIYGLTLVDLATQDVVDKKVYTTQSGDYNYQTHFSKDGKYYEIIITK